MATVNNAPSEVKCNTFKGKFYYLECDDGKVKYQLKNKENESYIYIAIKYFPKR